jgi:hypothetical protein
MSTKMGRPPLPKSQAKYNQVGVRFNSADVAKIERAIGSSSQPRTKAEWIRDAALSTAEQWERPALSAEIFWGELPYPIADIDGKRIEFKALIKWPEHKEPAVSSGTGTIDIRERPGGFHVRIVSRYSREREKVIDLSAQQARLIKRQPKGSECEFSLVATQF